MTPPAAPPRPKIVVIEDMPVNIRILHAVLSRDFDVRCATRGAEGLDLVAREHPDLVVLDVMMPEMDGYEVCRRLKADPVTAVIPVIFITALDEAEEEARGLELGAVDYLTKPITPAIVLARVKTHVELKRLRDRLELMTTTDGLTGVVLVVGDGAGGQVGLSRQHQPEGVDHGDAAHRLGNEARGSGLHRPQHRFAPGVAGENHQRYVGVLAVQGFDAAHAVHARHRKIEQNQPQLLGGGGCRLGFAEGGRLEHDDVVGQFEQERRQPLAQQLMIVGDQNFQHEPVHCPRSLVVPIPSVMGRVRYYPEGCC